jgi:hypothetical protein
MATYRIEPPVDSEPEDSPQPVGPPFAGSDASVDDILDSAMTGPS